MKITTFIFSIIMSFGSFADAELYCKSDNGSLIAMSDEEDFFLNCGNKMYIEDAVCFTGSREETISLIRELNNRDLYSGEVYFKDSHYKGKDEISYELWDGPNDSLMYNMSIKRCSL